MVEVFISIAAKIAEYTVAPVGRWLCYSFHYNSNIQNLKNQIQDLQHAKNRVQHSVDDAFIGHEIEGDVKAWLEKVDRIIILATGKLGESEEEAGTRSSIATCLNLKKRHQLSRDAKKLEKNIAELLKNGKFDKVTYLAALDEMVTTGDVDYMAMDSRMTTFKAIMEALGSVAINKIGVWGMPGVGKSTLMREIARQAREDKLFNKVVMVIVTESPDVKRIQEEIVDMLGQKFDQETAEKGKASLLRQELSKGKKILVILDDIWKELDLQQIGIPSEGCKLVMTSRNKDVLISGMGAQIDIELKILQEEEAWNLFKKMAGGDSLIKGEVERIATEVAKECAGLPIALVTVSKALKNKSSAEWKDSLRRLKRPAPQHITKMLKTIYSPIELSYDNLESPELKSLFLFCAQFSYFIHYQDLLKCTYGYGLFHGIDTLEEARNNLDTLLRQLKDSSLLLESSNGFYLHDLVRVVATIIASKDHNMFVMRDEGGRKALPDVDSLKRCQAFSILGRDIDQLPYKMECPELKFFYIHGNEDLEIPDTLFQGMDELKVLDLNEMRLSSLPSSLLLLRNLQALCLNRCELEDISGIGELKNLVILSLRDSKISELPREVGSLVRLRMLDLSNCFKLKMIPANVLSNLVKLEELYMGNSFAEWEVDQGLNAEREYANLAELKQMSLLTTLEIEIPNANNLPKASLFEKLKRYTICIGDDDWVWDWNDGAQFSRTLKLKLKTSFQLEVWIKMLLNRTEDLHLDELNGVKSVIPEMDGDGFQQLKHLHIQNNSEIKHIVNLRSSVIAFPILEKFVVQYMKNLEEIFCGKLSPASFKNLRVLKVEKCEKLRFVFSSSIAKELSLLEELKVTSCHKMVAIVVTEEEEDGIKDGDMILFCKLKKLVLDNLPEPVSFLTTKNPFMTDCGEIITEGNHDVHMTLLHHQVVALPSLAFLTIDGLPKIKHVWTECSETNCRFQNLKLINVCRCESLKSIFPTSATSRLQQLEFLWIDDCDLEEIVSVEGGEAVATLQFPRVINLQLDNLRRLKWFYKGVHVSKWPMLKSMWIEGCEQIETLVSGIHVSFGETVGENIKQSLFLVDEHSFPSLEKLVIQDMEQLEIIWQD